MTTFEFFHGLSPPRGNKITIPRNIKTRNDLFSCLAKLLKFPDYFGKNWDALDECLSDLSWIDQKPIILLHEDLPLQDKGEQKIYLEIIEESIEEGHKLRAIFPWSSHEMIEKLLSKKIKITEAK